MAADQKTKPGEVHAPLMPNFRVVCGETDASDTPKLYRSSRPDFLSMEEVASFNSLGIKCIIDFRSGTEYKKADGHKLLDLYFPVYKVKLPFNLKYKSQEEVRLRPLKLPSDNNHIVQHGNTERRHLLIDFFKYNYIWAVFNRAPWYIRLYSLIFLLWDLICNTGYRHFVRCFARNVLNHSGLGGQYVDMIRFSQASICAALKVLSNEKNLPAMLNCAHGKDRTGVVSAMVLGVLGKPKEVIAEDYARSEVELAPIKSRVHKEIVTQFDMKEDFTKAQASNMMEALNFIEQEYGGIPQYLDSIGFSYTEQDQLRCNLLGRSPPELFTLY